MHKLVSIFILSFAIFSSWGKDVLRVGVYDFRPYYDTKTNRGLTVNTLEILNKMQSNYTFKSIPIPAKRRFESLSENKIDLIIFEDINWGWKSTSHDFLPLKTEDGEIYIALKSKAVNQNYFEKFKGKKIAGILGFHYAITNFSEVTATNTFDFDFTQVSDPENLINLVLNRRTDVGIVTRSYFYDYQKRYPGTANAFISSDHYDHRFQLGLLISPKLGPIKPKLKTILESLEKNPSYQAKLVEYGVKHPSI